MNDTWLEFIEKPWQTEDVHLFDHDLALMPSRELPLVGVADNAKAELRQAAM
jgi:hypothetical protein